MRSSSSGLLLLVLAVVGLVGFLTGSLDRWLAYLFDPAKPKLSGPGAGATGTTAVVPNGAANGAATAAYSSALVSIGSTTPRAIA